MADADCITYAGDQRSFIAAVVFFLLVMPSPISERTPLLRSVSPKPQDDSSVTEDEVTATEVAQQGESGAPQFPELGNCGDQSHGQSIVPDDGPGAGNLVKFQENGKLEGVGVWKFRFVFGGILLGYFVSLTLSWKPG